MPLQRTSRVQNHKCIRLAHEFSLKRHPIDLLTRLTPFHIPSLLWLMHRFHSSECRSRSSIQEGRGFVKVCHARQVAPGHKLVESLSWGRQTGRGLAACSGSRYARHQTARMGSHAKGDRLRRLQELADVVLLVNYHITYSCSTSGLGRSLCSSGRSRRRCSRSDHPVRHRNLHGHRRSLHGRRRSRHRIHCRHRIHPRCSYEQCDRPCRTIGKLARRCRTWNDVRAYLVALLVASTEASLARGSVWAFAAHVSSLAARVAGLGYVSKMFETWSMLHTLSLAGSVQSRERWP